MWETLFPPALLFSSVRTDRTKSPGLDSDSLTRKVPDSSRAQSSFSAFCPDRWPWYHLRGTKGNECFPYACTFHLHFSLFVVTTFQRTPSASCSELTCNCISLSFKLDILRAAAKQHPPWVVFLTAYCEHRTLSAEAGNYM